MRILFKNKRAASTVIATILMIMVTMVGMGVAFAAVIVYCDTYRNGAGSAVLESLTVEDVWIQSGNTVQITLYSSATAANLGTDSGIDSTIAAIYANGTALTSTIDSKITQANPRDFRDYTVTAGSHFTIEGKSTTGFTPGNVYTFKVVTVRGASFQSLPIEYKG
jgi:FlaG/FlaF family flagellin (archaellin)